MWPGPYGEGGSRKYLLSSLDASLSRLGTDVVDIFTPIVMTPPHRLKKLSGRLRQRLHKEKHTTLAFRRTRRNVPVKLSRSLVTTGSLYLSISRPIRW